MIQDKRGWVRQLTRQRLDVVLSLKDAWILTAVDVDTVHASLYNDDNTKKNSYNANNEFLEQ